MQRVNISGGWLARAGNDLLIADDYWVERISISADLQFRWAYDTGDKTHTINQPLYRGDVVYVQSWDGQLVALDVATGAQRWTANVGRSDYFIPLRLDAGVLYAWSSARGVTALQASTGAVLWSVNGDLLGVGDGTAYVVLRDDPESDGILVALRSKAG